MARFHRACRQLGWVAAFGANPRATGQSNERKGRRMTAFGADWDIGNMSAQCSDYPRKQTFASDRRWSQRCLRIFRVCPEQSTNSLKWPPEIGQGPRER
jgi:hypothetical protein